MLITFEGIDGSGKSTQARMLEEHLRGDGRSVRLVREPGGPPLAERIRSLLLSHEMEISPFAELLLFSAARAQLVRETIQPALKAGSVGANVRGGRASGMVFYIDGVSLRNPFTGYSGQGVGGAGASGAFRGPSLDMSITTELPEFAFQEVEMLTGGYSPEYGNAQDAVINIATKEGSATHHGMVRVTTEGILFSDWNGVETRDFLIDPDLALPPDYIVESSVGEDSLVANGGYLWIGGQKVYSADLEAIHDASVLDSYGISYAESTPIWTMTYGDFERQKVSYNFNGPLFANAFYSLSGEWMAQARGAWGGHERVNNNYLAKLTYQLNARTKFNLSVLSSKQEYDIFSYGTTSTGYLKYQGGYLPGYG
ncbi:MAG: hypothetical protein IIB09_01445, partial [Bacteroidetes bacterium]|nr:hypothetical protein [Bacteroidota bacterium]